MTQKPAKRKPGRPKKSPSPKHKKPKLTNEQWLGLKREFHGCHKEWQQDGWPSGTPAQTVAKFAGVSRQIVHRWREDPQYLRGLEWLLIEKLSQRPVYGDQDEPKLGIADDNSEPDEFWVDPDPSLFEK